MSSAAELAVPQQTKRADLFAAIQTAHDKVPCVLITIPEKDRKYAVIIVPLSFEEPINKGVFGRISRVNREILT